jgi:hypothetical protein
MIDELEGELDELASGAAKRHVAGCARCAALYNGLRATRRVAVLPIVLPAADLEERILAATRAAQKVVPLSSRIGRAISSAGAWAMRPQTAMAALFLLMIGSSVLLLRGRARAPGSSSITVSEQGAPAPASPPKDDKDPGRPSGGGETAHGAPQETLAIATEGALREREHGEESRKVRGLVANDETKPVTAQNALPPTPDPLAQYAPATAAPPPATAVPPVVASVTGASSPFGSALSLFHEKRYAEAHAAFRAIGTPDADLYAARSQRNMSGCGAAVGAFEALMSRAWGSNAGYDAALDAARCQRAMGNEAAAKAHLTRLLGTPYGSLAKAELAAGENNKVDTNAPRPATTSTQAPATSASARPAL